jgi:tetraacyldisaccharide 4'-kinase
MTTARAAIERRLETTGRPALAPRLLSTAWNAVAARGIARPLALPRAAHVIGIGGATLGGSYKTPFAIALAGALSARGHAVALVGHAYRARPPRARVVSPGDRVAEVGDDALLAAQKLSATRATVVVGPSRQAAVDLAARTATILVVDGLLQARPARLARSILLVDRERGWGNGHCPPAGDLRAAPAALLASTDALAAVADDLAPASERGASLVGQAALEPRTGAASPPPRFDVLWGLDRAIHPDGTCISLTELRGEAVGVVLAVAHPERVMMGLARRGLRIAATALFADHHCPTRETVERIVPTTQRIDIWLTTGKCATKLPAFIGGAPVLALDHAVRIPESLLAWADALFPSAGAVG